MGLFGGLIYQPSPRAGLILAGSVTGSTAVALTSPSVAIFLHCSPPSPGDESLDREEASGSGVLRKSQRVGAAAAAFDPLGGWAVLKSWEGVWPNSLIWARIESTCRAGSRCQRSGLEASFGIRTEGATSWGSSTWSRSIAPS